MLKRKGQSTVEYIMLVTAVIGVCVLFMIGKNSPFKTKLNDTMGVLSNQMTNMATRMANSN